LASADPPVADPLEPGPQGLAEDLPCPRCDYNLRGLAVPRCPECGYRFTWSDLPRLRAELLEKKQAWKKWLALGLAPPIVALPLLITPLVILILVPVITFAVSAFQASIEIAIAWPFLRTLSWRRFRAWWEGVLIGYGLCAVTCLALGRPMMIADRFIHPGSFPLVPLLVITAVESFAVQWWVVRYRARQWNDPLPAGRLTLACLAAKALVAIPWTLIVTQALVR
jgi:hypothetical protein